MTDQSSRRWTLETAPDVVALEFAHEFKNEWLAVASIVEKGSQIAKSTNDELLSTFTAIRDPLMRMRFIAKDAFWYLGNRPKTVKDSRMDTLEMVVHDLLVYLNTTIGLGDYLLKEETVNEADCGTYRNALARNLQKIEVIVGVYLDPLPGNFRLN
jgi:hypothetical protein